MRFALSRDRRVAPKPSSSASIETLTKSPGFTSTCAGVVRNSSIGMMLSDFSPAFTTTKLSSTLTHLGGDDLADAHLLAVEAFLEERGERFAGGSAGRLRTSGTAMRGK